MEKVITLENPQSNISEAYRSIRTGIEFSNLDKNLKIICVTSSKQDEGKTTVISNLGVSFAKLDKKVLLIDGDLRNPSINRIFGLKNSQGLMDILLGTKDINQCIKLTKQENLYILTGGIIPPDPSEVLSSKKMGEFLEGIRDKYDYIFIDTPPIGIVSDASIVSSYSDGVIFVVGANEVDATLAKMAKERLEAINANIIGVILNKYKTNINSEYYSYYYRSDNEKVKKKKKRKK
ncbi:MAG: CpsD/CapB family tyrosine-protein kinase [Romboutsia timonensis]|uniref:CpsD/CapB family tyrosine-protein kinase n=1 Tax=Romboutsia timonensis TaxID=1776391 RepID=UPI002A75E9E4|nr:CpsD/CapB family tyrosine-protein kinase [Romboutsia timonensis]MDY2884048.1 CpsD/CapB family tyrosine-protein kinase [Romboutsia timonensis]